MFPFIHCCKFWIFPSDIKREYGSDRKDIIKNIRGGIIEKGMPAWEGALSQKEIEELAVCVSAKTKSK